MNYPSVAKARLPQSYIDAIDSLRLCAKSFSPERYFAASTALKRCLATDDCSSWPADMDTTASYVRVGSDNTLMRLAAKVDRLRHDWVEEQGGAR